MHSLAVERNILRKMERMITQDISLYAERALTRWNTPGLSLGIVRVNESGEVRTEFAGWGKATEHGDKSNAEVGGSEWSRTDLKHTYYRLFTPPDPAPRRSQLCPSVF